MAKPLFKIVSIRKLRQLAQNPGPEEALGLLARNIVNVLDARGEADAEAAFCEVMQDYFYNLAALSKRRYADAIALAFCEERSAFDDLWDYLKSVGVTGRTKTKKV
jgi:hypothetical protein